MKPDVEYPYMPADRHLKYVPADHEYMLAAKKAREEQAGDPTYPVGIVLVKDGQIVVSAGNGYNKGPQQHICRRIVMDPPSGTGYDLCDLHDAPGHSEQMAVKVAEEQGIDLEGADAYMYGHWWACEPCWNALIDAGVQDLYVTDDAHERFHRDRVYGETMQPNIKTVYISGGLTNLPEENKNRHKQYYEELGAAAEELGIQAYIPLLHSDPERNPEIDVREVFDMDCQKIMDFDVVVSDLTYPSLGTGGELMLAHFAKKPLVVLSKKGTRVSRFALGNPAVVYHIEYDDYAEACKKLKNVLKQL